MASPSCSRRLQPSRVGLCSRILESPSVNSGIGRRFANCIEPHRSHLLHGKHISKEKTARKRRKRVAKAVAVCVTAACCLALAAGGAFAAVTIMGKGNLLRGFSLNVPEGLATSDGGKTVISDGSKYVQKAGMTSILLLGRDGRQTEELNGQADFIMVAAIDTDTGETTLIYIPRDTMVDVQRTYDHSDEYADTVTMQIAAAFAYGSDFEHSAKRMCDVVSHLLLNVPLDYFFLLDINGIGALADAVDGVQLESIEDVPKTDMKEGERLDLRGESARLYVTERDTHEAWSAGKRLERQKQFVSEYVKKLLEMVKNNPQTVMDVVDSVSSYSITNLGPNEIAYLASLFSSTGLGGMNVVTLPGESVYNEETGYEEYHVDSSDVMPIVLDVYYEPA